MQKNYRIDGAVLKNDETKPYWEAPDVLVWRPQGHETKPFWGHAVAPFNLSKGVFGFSPSNKFDGATKTWNQVPSDEDV